ncbi:type-F conjugative transfer system pilin assembly protein TrbC [Parasutterella secunda]|uniref:TrbC family F-type conjugative pilus assembly protein n=1 Tax=Parasutterella secunda TaxID=626947 RepID=UPI0020116A76|nr:TrbC family F-type conjugative pilus assembly protein [Parasutterella secunda]MCL1596971.1 type-F conjugative transfer system pilin assembly protein TrbC [Parasutterella secunda]
MKRFLMTLAFLLPLNTYALTPGEVQAIVQQAQESVQTLPQTQEEDIAIAITVSLSMPRASLLKLGQDARDAGLALTFRGVGTEIQNRPDEKPRTIAQRYGKGLIARHMEDFKFLTDAGANVQIDPVLFTRHNITDVPRVMVVPVCRSACERTQAILVARGDVSLRYALDALFKDVTNRFKTEPENKQLLKAKSLLEEKLLQLGDRE